MRVPASHVSDVREAMGLDPFAFAAVLGVHVSTVYRWEKKGSAHVDPLQFKILDALYKRLTPKKSLSDLGEKVIAKLSSGGGTFVGLHTVLTFLINK